MKRLFIAATFLSWPLIVAAQEMKGPQVTGLHMEVFPVNSSPVGTIVTTDYGIKMLEVGKLRFTASGFVDLEPAADRRLYYMNHGQVLKYGRIPIGLMFEEAAGRPQDLTKPTNRFARAGLTTNLNDIPGINRLTRPGFRVFNVSWLNALTRNIQDEIKLYVASKDLPIGIGWINVEGFYRIRYGSRDNLGQPQLVFRPAHLTWLKLVLEVEQNGRNVDLYFGPRITFVKK